MEYFAKITLNEDAFNAHNEKCGAISKEEYLKQEFGWVHSSGIGLTALHYASSEQDTIGNYKTYLMDYAMSFKGDDKLPMSYETYLKRFNSSQDEIDVLYAILRKLRIEDIELSWSKELELFAKDADNVWCGKEFYEFLFNEVFVYNEDSSVLGIPNELYSKYIDLAETYNICCAEKERAKYYIAEYVAEELNSEAKFFDLSLIPIGYTTTEDGEHEIQAYADIIDYRIYTTVDEVVVRERKYDSLQSLIDNELTTLCFDELVSINETEIAIANQKNESLNTVDTLKINVAGGRLEATVMHDSDYPGIDVEYIPNCDKPCGMFNPRVLVEFPKDDQLRALIWDDPKSEDYTKEIIFQNKTFECPLGGDETNDCADCAYSCDYHFKNGECVRREDDANG